MASYTLGLDIGSNSIGWALLGHGKKPSIIDLGVRVFPEGVDRNTKGRELSKNATRRLARGARRTRQRRNLRRDQLKKILTTAGLLLQDPTQSQQLLTTDPYPLRAKGLDEKLTLHEFGRVLYHINQRRGFKSNRKTGKAKEDGKVATEASQLQNDIDQAGCRTLGEYLNSLDPETQRRRERYTFRSMYIKEFNNLWEKQAEHYSDVLTEDLRQQVRDKIIFYQRPLKPTDDLIGDCDWEPGEKRCPRGDWFARRFRLLQDVNNLKIQDPDGLEHKLTAEQRQILLKELAQKKEIPFDKIRTILGLTKTQLFNLEQDGKVKKLKGDVFAAAMRKIFGVKKWDSMDENEKINLNNACLELDNDELVEKMKTDYDFNEKQLHAVLKILLPQRYMSFSRKAIRKLLPFIEQGALTHEAIEAAYSKEKTAQKDDQPCDRLPAPDDLRNPIVNKALVEVRKVVRAIIREYGKPGRIRIEMARDVKGNIREREELHFKMRENQKRNAQARTRLIQDMNIPNPSRDDIIKYKLWEECGKICPYTGKHISQTALFGPNPEFQVEHILPYDRSLDDSFMNKTLCEVHENVHIKRGQTPYEAYSRDAEKYEQIKQRIKVLLWPKRRKFLQKEINLDECINRELNDTRYICKEVVKYIKHVCPNVTGTRGKVTAELRYQWGFTKDRDDHHHHAIDAVVVAVTEQKHLRELAQSKFSVQGIVFAPPWPHFREELAERINEINVSHRPTRKVSGQLHEETSYGLTDRKDQKGQDIFVYRKKIEDLTCPMVRKIVDRVVRQLVRERLAEHGIDLARSEKIPKDVWNKPLYMRQTKSNKKVQIKKVRIQDVFNNMILLKDLSGKPYRAVAPGNNHHIEVFEYKDKKGNSKRDGKVVTMFEAVQRSQNKQPVIQRSHGPGKKFICSLAINEMFMLQLDDGSTVLHRVQKISQNSQVFFRPHTYAGDLKKQPPVSKMPNTLKGYKVTIDPLGRIYPAND